MEKQERLVNFQDNTPFRACIEKEQETAKRTEKQPQSYREKARGAHCQKFKKGRCVVKEEVVNYPQYR